MGESSGMAELGIRLVGSLAVVVGLLILIARLVNRRFKPADGAPVRVVHRQPLTRGSGVAVVAVGTRVLVLGTTEQQVTLLAEVEPDEIGLDEEYEHDEEVSIRPRLAARPTRPASADGRLAGSLLSADTWRQTLAAFSGSRDGRGATSSTTGEPGRATSSTTGEPDMATSSTTGEPDMASSSTTGEPGRVTSSTTEDEEQRAS
ncbi:flagellar biogenesis protein FliO [Nocardioides thalensis]|uniref:Flagellar biogenesis protein FliO n=1 Tax=Nocardioides thalensis TaxID=1914755 RepID=A0A853BXG9_9ACTN|nr:flagellar biosynthetic protein FliO [Nocardioides thalensis]NYI99814.1 flagellar biogenesis protein FliO [Nocardioides thalensis]